jgi:hypothetical protein
MVGSTAVKALEEWASMGLPGRPFLSYTGGPRKEHTFMPDTTLGLGFLPASEVLR